MFFQLCRGCIMFVHSFIHGFSIGTAQGALDVRWHQHISRAKALGLRTCIRWVSGGTSSDMQIYFNMVLSLHWRSDYMTLEKKYIITLSWLGPLVKGSDGSN